MNEPGVWKDVALQFLEEQKTRSKAVGVRVTKSATTKALQLITIANPAVAEAMSRELVPVAIRAFQQWPIRKTGTGEVKAHTRRTKHGPVQVKAHQRPPQQKKTKRGKPRGPGFSKSLLLLLWKARSSTEFSGSIVNRADYSAVIRRGETGEDLVFKPGRKAAKRAAEVIARTLKREAEK